MYLIWQLYKGISYFYCIYVEFWCNTFVKRPTRTCTCRFKEHNLIFCTGKYVFIIIKKKNISDSHGRPLCVNERLVVSCDLSAEVQRVVPRRTLLAPRARALRFVHHRVGLRGERPWTPWGRRVRVVTLVEEEDHPVAHLLARLTRK